MGQPQSVRLIPGIITAVQEHEVEVIHSHSTFGYLPLILVKPFLRVPMVTHVHATTAGWAGTRAQGPGGGMTRST